MGRPVFDPGLTQQYGGRLRRTINDDGSFNVVRSGFGFRDAGVYLHITGMSWPRFLALIVAGFFAVNMLFACIYMLLGVENLQGADLTSATTAFQSAFFFSVHTLTTVGYGNVAPKGFAVNLTAAIETLIGLFTLALGTGLLYGRFSRPSANIVFSRHMIVAPHQGKTALMFRIANRRPNILMELEATMVLMTVETVDGVQKRQYAELPLERNKIFLLPLSWTLVHPIDEASPLWRKPPEELRASQAELLILIKSFDDTFGQFVHARHSYTQDEIVWGMRFLPSFHVNPEGNLVLELDHLHRYEPAGPA
jgi:inward rectifier potassium channel